jgi:hypothetical protein
MGLQAGSVTDYVKVIDGFVGFDARGYRRVIGRQFFRVTAVRATPPKTNIALSLGLTSVWAVEFTEIAPCSD